MLNLTIYSKERSASYNMHVSLQYLKKKLCAQKAFLQTNWTLVYWDLWQNM